jgi:hypothetical protein
VMRGPSSQQDAVYRLGRSRLIAAHSCGGSRLSNTLIRIWRRTWVNESKELLIEANPTQRYRLYNNFTIRIGTWRRKLIQKPPRYSNLRDLCQHVRVPGIGTYLARDASDASTRPTPRSWTSFQQTPRKPNPDCGFTTTALVKTSALGYRPKGGQLCGHYPTCGCNEKRPLGRPQ